MGGSFPFGFGPGEPGGSDKGPEGAGGSGNPFDLFGQGAPFFRELERMLAGQSGPINWEFARQIAVQSTSAADPEPSKAELTAVREAGRLADLWLDDQTDLAGVGVEMAAWRRSEWVRRTLPVWQQVCDPVAGRIVDAMGKGLLGGLSSLTDHPALAGQLPAGMDLSQLANLGGPLTGMLRQVGGLLFGAQVGSALGGLAADVLSPTEVGLPLGPPALLPANVAAFAEGLEVELDEIRLFLALRELAHQRLFQHVPWLRAHLLSAVEDYARGITVDPGAIGRAVSELDPFSLDPSSLNPERLSSLLGNEAFGVEQTPQQRAALTRLETALALIEGWVDEVSQGASGQRLASGAALAETMRRRRATGGPAEQTFAALVGLELRPRRLREASRLWRLLREQRGVDGRDAVWGHPDLMPTGDDLDDPDAYVARTGESGETFLADLGGPSLEKPTGGSGEPPEGEAGDEPDAPSK